MFGRSPKLVALASLIGVAVLAGSLPGPALAADSQTATPTIISTPGSSPLYVADPALYKANGLAKARGGLGAYRDQVTRQIVVVMPSPVAASFTATDAASVAATVTVRRSAFDSSSIASMESEVEALHAGLVGKQAIVSGYDISQDQFTIRSNARASLFAGFMAEHPGEVTYTYGDVSSYNRDNDNPPHWGGATLDRPYPTPWCTAGYPVRVGSTTYMVTAGHCFNPGDSVVGNTGWNWGTIISRNGYPDTDVELIGGSTYEGAIYTGYSSHQWVKGYVQSLVGSSPYCLSGWASGNNCDYTETADNLTETFSNGNTTSGLVQLAGPHTGMPGDSGGPVYATNGNAFIFGSVVGGSGCNFFTCITYLEPYTRVQSVYGASLVTG